MVDMIERRKHKRYAAKIGTFALLRSTSIELSKINDMSLGQIGFAVIKSKPIKMGQIINISRDGLAFDYIEHQGNTIEAFKLDILYAEDAYYLGKLLFKTIYDYSIDSDIPLSTFTIRRCGVQFGELTHRQNIQLEYFLNNHRLSEEKMIRNSPQWENDRITSSNDTQVASIII